MSSTELRVLNGAHEVIGDLQKVIVQTNDNLNIFITRDGCKIEVMAQIWLEQRLSFHASMPVL